MNKEELMYVLNTSIECDPLNESIKMTQFVFDPETQQYAITLELQSIENVSKKAYKVKKEEGQ